ncbi:MAG: hypothetical protein ACLP9C_10630 [Acidimicrobiales bacterium]
MLTLAAYAAGALIGLGVARGGPRLQADWPLYLRAQLLVTAAATGLFAAWELSAPRQVIGPFLIAGVGWVLLGAAVVTRRRRSMGQAALESWAAGPNGAFWVLPIAGVIAGPPAIMIAALANAFYAGANAVCIHLMRRDAPLRQRHATSWVDQSALLALAVGLLIHLVGPAPSWSHLVLRVSAPVLAFTGAGLFIGSVVHPHNVAVGRARSDTWRWLALAVLRAAYLGAIAVATTSRPLAVVAVLSALGAPAFNPIQQAVLYGYRSGLVNAAVRWGWFALPVGLVAALLI